MSPVYSPTRISELVAIHRAVDFAQQTMRGGADWYCGKAFELGLSNRMEVDF